MSRLFLAGTLLLSALMTQAEVEITGFVDVLGQREQGAKTSFGMGAFEIDFASEFSERVSFEGAIVVEDEAVGLGQTMVDIKLLSDDKMGLQTGLLDIPFGLDYQVFATPDRKLISPPLVTELMMDGGWGDIGVNLHGTLPFVDYNLYVVNGMGNNNNSKTIGGRVNIVPVEYVGFGASYAWGPYNKDEKSTWQRAGGHIQFSYGQVEAKGEFFYAKEEVSETNINEHAGLYLQILGKATEKIYGVARYGGWNLKGVKTITRITACLGYDFLENVSIRAEYQLNKEKAKEDNDLFSLQVVISF